jgi:hypothetical protein
MQKNTQKHRHQKIYTKTLAHPKTLADTKTLAHPKTLADTKTLAHPKTIQKHWPSDVFATLARNTSPSCPVSLHGLTEHHSFGCAPCPRRIAASAEIRDTGMPQARATLSHTVSIFCCPLHTRSFHVERLVQQAQPHILQGHLVLLAVTRLRNLQHLPLPHAVLQESAVPLQRVHNQGRESPASSHGDPPRGIP